MAAQRRKHESVQHGERERDGGELSRAAWVGDAVLLLFARSYVLHHREVLDESLCVRMTSNQFLSALGEPTQVEAEIGRIFLSLGLDAAYGWITEHLIPIFERQEENRRRRKGVHS